jgi:hypothetical protein
MAAAVAAREEMIFSSQSNRTDRALNRVRVQLDAAVVQEAGQTVPARSGSLGQGAASRQQREPRFEPDPHGLDDGLRAIAASREPMRKRLTANVGFDGIEFAAPAQRLCCDRRVGGLRHLVEPSSRMTPACSEHDVTFVRQGLEAGIAVDMQNAPEVVEMRSRALSLAVRREEIDGGRRRAPPLRVAVPCERSGRTRPASGRPCWWRCHGGGRSAPR